MSSKSKKPQRPGGVAVERMVSLHPAAKSFNEWLNSEEGKACTEGVQIGAELHGHYMENRCHRAYNAGWRDVLCRLTTQAQRPGPRDAWIATRARWPGSLQRTVSPHGHANEA